MGSIAPLIAKMGLDTTGFVQGADKAATTAERSARRISSAYSAEMRATREAAQSTTAAIDGMFGKLAGSIKTAVAGFAAVGIAQLGREALQTAESFHQTENRIRNATRATGDFQQVTDALFASAQKTGVAFDSTAQVFQRMALAGNDLGKTNTEMVKMTDLVQKLGVIGGSSTQAMNAGLMQFSQLLSMGQAHAEELNSIAENLPALQARITEGFGMSWAEIKKAAADGKILSKDVFDVLIKQAGDINKQFAEMPPTMEQGWNAVGNAVGEFLGTLDTTLGVTKNVGIGFKEMSKAIEDAAKEVKTFGATTVEIGGQAVTITNAIAASWTTVWEAIKRATEAGKHYQEQTNASKNPFEQALRSDIPGFGLNPFKGIEQTLAFFNAKGYGNGRSFEDIAKEIQNKKPDPVAPKAPRKGAAGDDESTSKLKEYIADLKQAVHHQEQINQGKAEQAAIDKALYDAADKAKRNLTDKEKIEVTNAAKAKFRAEEEQKAINANAAERKKAQTAQEAADKKAQADAEKIIQKYMDINKEIEARANGMALSNAKDDLAAKLAHERYEMEKKISDLKGNPLAQAELRDRFESYAQAALGNERAQKMIKQFEEMNDKMGGMSDAQWKRGLGANDGLEGQLAKEWNERLSKLENLGASGSDIGHAKSLFDEDANRRRTEAWQQQLRTLEEQTQEMAQQEREKDLINQGLDQQAAYEREVLSLQKQMGRELSAQERQQVAQNVAMQDYYRKMGQARDLIESMKSKQEKYNDRVRELSQLYNAGLISINQYNRALAQMSPYFEKMHSLAQSLSQSLGNAFDSALLKGEKFTDVLKNLGKEILNIVAHKLFIDPLVNGMTGWLTQLFTGVNPNAPIGPFAPRPMPGVPGAPGVGIPGALGGIASAPWAQLLGGAGQIAQGPGSLWQKLQQAWNYGGSLAQQQGGGGSGVPGTPGAPGRSWGLEFNPVTGSYSAAAYSSQQNEIGDMLATESAHVAGIYELLRQFLPSLAQCACGPGGPGGAAGAPGGGGFPYQGLPPMAYGAGAPQIGLPYGLGLPTGPTVSTAQGSYGFGGAYTNQANAGLANQALARAAYINQLAGQGTYSGAVLAAQAAQALGMQSGGGLSTGYSMRSGASGFGFAPNPVPYMPNAQAAANFDPGAFWSWVSQPVAQMPQQAQTPTPTPAPTPFTGSGSPFPAYNGSTGTASKSGTTYYPQPVGQSIGFQLANPNPYLDSKGAVARLYSFAGYRAQGGHVDAGKAYMVGEKVPEMFIPDVSGRIAQPDNKGSNVTVNVINNAGAQITRTSTRTPDGGERIDLMIDQVVANQIENNGAAMQALARRTNLVRTPPRR